MAYEALLLATATVDTSVSDGTLTLIARGGDPSLEFALSAVSGAASQLDPTVGPGVVSQVVEIALSGASGGVPFEILDHFGTDGGIEVDRSMTEKTAWSLRAPASSGAWEPWALGYEVAFGGAPPPGLAKIDVKAWYGVGAGRFSVPLVTGGISTASSRPFGKNGHAISLSGLGPEGRYDRIKVTFSLPPNHGLTHGQIIQRIAEEAGVPSSLVNVDAGFGSVLYRPLDVTEEEAGSLWSEVALGAGGYIRWDEAGQLIAGYRAPVGPPRHRIGARRLLGGDISQAVSIEGNAEVVTCFRIEGTKPVIPENGAEGSVLTVTANKTFELDFRPREALFVQSDDDLTVDLDPLVGSTGSFLPVGAYFFDTFGRTLKAMTVTVKETVGGCLKSEDVLNFGWRVQEAARYQYVNPAQDDGEKEGIIGVFLFDAGAVKADSTPAYIQSRESWALISRERKDYVYGGGDDGHELATVRTRTGGYLNETNAAKTPSAPAPYDWPAENYIADQYVLGGGRVVKNLFETFRGGGEGMDYLIPYIGYVGTAGLNPTTLVSPLTDSLRTLTGKGGYLVREEESTQGYALRVGTGFWFEGDNVSASLFEEFVPTESKVTTYNAAPGDLTHKKVTTTTNDLTKASVSVVEDAQGYLPGIERCDPEDQARKEGEPFEAEVCSGLQWRLYNLQVLRNEFVEDVFKGGALATTLLREAQGIPCEVAIPLDATIRPGDTILLDLADPQIQLRGWVDRHKLAISGRLRYSLLSLRLHPA